MDMYKILNPDDVSRGVERLVIPLDDPSNLKSAADFVYVRHSVPGPDTDREAFSEQYAGCECTEVCSETCPCIKRFGRSYDESCRFSFGDPESSQMKPVFECNKDCKCSENCTNRVVQYGIGCSMQLFLTKSKGFGVRTLDNIPSNSFVCEYAGEILRYEDAKTRAKAMKPLDSNYILVVNEHLGSGNITATYVDPTFIGNVGRFLNHSCEPNLYMIPVRVNTSIPMFALFALRDIAAKEELCYDYSGVVKVSNGATFPDPIKPVTEKNNNRFRRTANGVKITPVETKAPRYTPKKECHCGSKQCRGFLPFDATLFQDDG